MKSILLAGIVVAMSISTAGAADSIATAPAGFVWTGGYVGLQAGYAWADAPYTDDFDNRIDYDPDGFFGGVYAGYNHQFQNNVVLGIDGDLNFSGIDGRSTLTFGGDTGPDPDHVANSKIKMTGALRGRLGYAMDRFLPYVAGGVSFAKFEFDLDHDGTGDWDFQEKHTYTGWNIGVGFDYAATDNIIVRAEYRYSDFGSQQLDSNWGDISHVKLQTHDVRLGVAYKF
jgi:outer membrane immunogenic protein